MADSINRTMAHYHVVSGWLRVNATFALGNFLRVVSIEDVAASAILGFVYAVQAGAGGGGGPSARARIEWLSNDTDADTGDALPSSVYEIGGRGDAPGNNVDVGAVACVYSRSVRMIALCDNARQCVQVYSCVVGQRPVFMFEFGAPGGAVGQFANARALALDEDGCIVVADTDNNRLQVFDRYGHFLRVFPDVADTATATRFVKPNSVAVTRNGHIVVGHEGGGITVIETGLSETAAAPVVAWRV
jgi:hypothetical protein